MQTGLERLQRELSNRTIKQLSSSAQAAVAIIFRAHNNLESDVFIIERAQHPADPWSGHLAFPGGRREDCDESLLATALREVKEEVGLALDECATYLGGLDHVRARGVQQKLTIAPYVFRLDEAIRLTPDPREVQRYFWVPLAPLLRGDRATAVSVTSGKLRYSMPAYEVQGKQLWGLTYEMLNAALRWMSADEDT